MAEVSEQHRDSKRSTVLGGGTPHGIHTVKSKTFFNSLQHVDGRGMLFFHVLFRRHGSIVPRTLPIAFLSAFISIVLLVCERFELVPRGWLPILRHPISVQMLGIILGYVVVLRSNVAVDRYFEGISNVQFFGSKWVDAYTQLCAFMRSSARIHRREGNEQAVLELHDLTLQLLHWFSLLHGLAINSLQITQMDLDDDEYFQRVQVRPLPRCDLFGPPEEKSSAGTAPAPRLSGKRSIRSAASQVSDSASPNQLAPLMLLGELDHNERKALGKAEDKVDLVHAWIIEAIASSSLDQDILTPSPILSRVYQELSNGMLGYNQAYKIALVQFPFAFAQVLTVFLIAFVFCCPIAVFVFTGGEFLTPALTLFTVLGFWGIHEIAVEVENPFGIDANQLPLPPLHDSVCEALYEASYAHLPRMRRDNPVSKEEIINGLT